MKQQRRGWLWLIGGVILALLAGALTFNTINDATTSAVKSTIQESATTQVLVAITDIAANQLVTQEMVEIKSVPVYVAPLQAATSVDQVVNRIATGPIPTGAFLLRTQLVNPVDPNAPVLYTMDPNQVLMAIPAAALLGRLGMLKVGDRVDIAYTTDLQVGILEQAGDQPLSEEAAAEAKENTDTIPVAFFSLQNVEIKGLSFLALGREASGVTAPDALLVAVNPQDALVLKYLMDTGANMDLFLRAPGNDSQAPMLPVDQEYLINRFQLHLNPAVNFANVPNVPSFGLTLPQAEPVVNPLADQADPGQSASVDNQ